ncbi:MAG: oligosaccharide flippase family protein, partial [bacterium]
SFGLFRNSSGLFWADLAGNISNNLSGIRQLRKTGFRLKFFSRNAITAMAKRYIAFPKFNLVPHMLGTIAMQLPVFMINRLFTKTDLGFYDLTQQAILAPFSLISVAISQVLLQRITEKKHRGEKIFRDFMNLSAMLLMIGLASFAVIELWGPQLFSLVFGNKCMVAGTYARVLIIGYIFFLVVSPMGAILLGLEKIRIFSLWNVLHFLLLIGLYFVRDITFKDFLLLFVSIEVAAFSILYFWITKTVMKYDRQLSHE